MMLSPLAITWPKSEAEMRKALDQMAHPPRNSMLMLQRQIDRMEAKFDQLRDQHELLRKSVQSIRAWKASTVKTHVTFGILEPHHRASRKLISNLVNIVCDINGSVSRSEILGESREHHVVIARHCIMHVAATRLGLSIRTISRNINRDRSTVLYGLRQVTSRPELYYGLLSRIDEVYSAAELLRSQEVV